MTVIKRKAFAYITHGYRLLIFSHPLAPDAGIQVPAGTIRDGERPEDAAMREAAEETGRNDLALVRFLGEHVRDMADCGYDEIHHRFFYHLRCTGAPPERWWNCEPDPADGGELPLFEFFGALLSHRIPDLIEDHGALLPALISRFQTGSVEQTVSPPLPGGKLKPRVNTPR
jgi:8-oxo-dGTP diphosphatase